LPDFKFVFFLDHRILGGFCHVQRPFLRSNLAWLQGMYKVFQEIFGQYK
jgi:hypothetical protein